MDFSWLGNLFGHILGIFNPLKSIKHWQIWVELKNWYERFKKWRDWYKQHVLTPMRLMQQEQRKIYNQFMRPILTLVDHIRQLAQIVGIFNKKLADKLNFYFFRIESYLLQPFNKMTSRTNALGMAVQSLVTPLGYLDRPTMLNSIWRDAKLVRGILHNPFDQHPSATTLPAGPSIADRTTWTKQYISNGSGPYAATVDAGALKYQQLKAGG